jgi:hypothetical protein
MSSKRMLMDSNHNVVQAFAPRAIVTATAGANTDMTGYLAFRVSEDSEYYINSDSGNTTTILAGSVTAVHHTVSTMNFTADTVLEVM